MEKLNFQMSFFQYLLLNDPSEIILICWFGAQETFFYYHCWKQLYCYKFLETMIQFYFSSDE